MLETVDLGRTLARDRAKELLPPLQERLRLLQYRLLEAEVPTIILFEGWDAAGKGTMIQRLTEKLDPRAFRAWPGSPPSELEQRFHWLRRYQARLPEDGHMALFDHSWYGRVLVERVEKFVKKREWRGAYEQINQLERWLVDDGQIVVKFFFHVSKKEQARRLKEIEKHPHEHWRVSDEEWRRNRAYDKWVEAIEDMLARTDTAACPWTLVEATDARWTRYRVLSTLVSRMEEALRHREEAPAEVSRTHRAQDATREEREAREREGLALVRDVAEQAGMPLEDEEA